MALAAGTIWEVRTTGNGNNGGGFIDRLPGTSIDYSQQNASQLSVTDLVGNAASVTVTSVIGGFTAGMVGNVLQIRAGLNFTVGFYEIVQFNSGNSVNLDRIPCSGAGSGGTGEVGGAIASIETFLLSGASGNTCYCKSGTYNFTGTRIQSPTSIRIIGYDASRDVTPMGNNRPLIQLGAFHIQSASGLQIKNIRLTGSGAQLLLGRAPLMKLFNCYLENLAVVGTVHCIYYDNGGATFAPKGNALIDCEFKGNVGATSYGFRYVGQAAAAINASGLVTAFCFFHDLTYGFVFGVSADSGCGIGFLFNTFARITNRAIDMTQSGTNGFFTHVLFNTFYQTDYDINAENMGGNIFYGNIFQNAVTVAIRDSVSNAISLVELNDFFNNGSNLINMTLGYGNLGLDPSFVNPAGNDFNLAAGSPLIAYALGIIYGV